MALNLYDHLTATDSQRITNFISEWGVAEGYIGNDAYLDDWRNNKKKLFHLLGGELIYRFPFSYEKPLTEISNEIERLIIEQPFVRKYREAITAMKFDDRDLEDELEWLPRNVNALRTNEISDISVKYKQEGKKNTLQLSSGMKPMRAIQKVLTYFELDDLKEDFEAFRIAHSMILNEKVVKGNMCISIHPLDFLTMSDNDSDWSSCMSWKEDGCYHIGTVEMMNSNNVVCCYMESSKPFKFGTRADKKNPKTGNEWEWNNKKWRQLFYVTKDIIVSGKSYPYENKSFTMALLETLRRLAKENLNWTYTFGPELYKDMIHTGSAHRMNRNREWIQNRTAFKHNILFDTNGMYNDVFNDTYREYWCVRNKVKRAKMISLSGKAPCLCCKEPVLSYDDDCWGYNDRYTNTKYVICNDCQEQRSCDQCHNETRYYTSHYLQSEDKWLCDDCWNKYVKTCPDCGNPFTTYDYHEIEQRFLIRITDKDIEGKEILRVDREGGKPKNFVVGCACKKCTHERTKSGFRKITVDMDYGYWRPHWNLWVSNEVYDKESEMVKRYSRDNLDTPSAN